MVSFKTDTPLAIRPPTPPESEHSSTESPNFEKGEVPVPLPPSSTEPTEVLEIDAETPDSHVPRDPQLIRLTGVHPFNVEPPLSTLYDQGEA